MMKLLILIIAIFAICNANPIRDELHARVNQLSELKNQLEHAKHAFLRFNEVAAQTHRVHTEILNNANSKRDTRATQECLAALANLNQVSTNGSCSVSLATYFSFTNTSSSQKQQAVTNFCTNCQQPYVQAVKGVITACNISDFGQDLIRAAGFYPRFICAQVNGQFCANVINDLSSQVPTDITKFDDSLLGKICTPCVSLALNILQQGSVSDLALYTRSVLVLRGVCVKIAGKFCFGQIRDNYNTLLQVGAKLNSTDMNASDLQKVLNFFCAPCYRLVAARLALSSGVQGFDLIGSFSVVGALCRKNAAREFCLVKIFDAAKPFLAAGVTGGKLPCDNSGNSNGTCSSDCQNVIRNFVNKGGCCWAILVDFVTKIGPGADSQVKDAIYAGLKQCVPDLKIPDPCVSVAKATIKLTYTNLIVNNQQAFINAVLKDLAVAVGQYDSVNSASITVTTNKRANEASISIPVTTSGTLGATLNVQETVCSSVCATTPIADPTAEVTVRSETSNLSVTSSSSFLTFSFALFFILSVFFF